MARKNGCPTNIRDWQIDIMSRASTRTDPTWIRIKGLTDISVSVDADTEDTSAAESLYAEPSVTKRSGSISLDARPIYDRVTGAHDPGQEELDYYLTVGGCDGDAVLRLVDPCGHAEIIDVVVTGKENSVDDSSDTISYTLERVGESESVPYVQVTAISTDQEGNAVSLAVGATKTVNVSFTPTTASNQKYAVASADTTKVRVDNIDGLTFELVGVAPTTEAVRVVVRSVNNSREVTLNVTVTDNA